MAGAWRQFEFDVTAALDECRELLVRHGGHARAAGFTVLNENLPALRSRLAEIAAAAGVSYVREGYVDLNYDRQGNLVIERNKGAWDPEEVAARAVRLATRAALISTFLSILRSQATISPEARCRPLLIPSACPRSGCAATTSPLSRSAWSRACACWRITGSTRIKTHKYLTSIRHKQSLFMFI